MDYYDPKYAYNSTVDWDKLQGLTHPSDSHVIPRRDLNYRYVSIQNSSKRPMGVGISTYYCGGPIPDLLFVLGPGEVKAVGINGQNTYMQYLYPLDPLNKKQIGHPYPFRSDSNTFVLRDGLQNVYIQPFKYPTFRPAF